LNSLQWYLVLFVFLGFVVHYWLCAVEFTNKYGGPTGIDNHMLLKHISDFTEDLLEGVYNCQGDTCESVANSYDKKFKYSLYVYD